MVRIIDPKSVYEASLANFNLYLKDLGLDFFEIWSRRETQVRVMKLFDAFNLVDLYGKTPVVNLNADYLEFVRTLVCYYKWKYGVVPYLTKEEFLEDSERGIQEFVKNGWVLIDG